MAQFKYGQEDPKTVKVLSASRREIEVPEAIVDSFGYKRVEPAKTPVKKETK